MATDNIGSALGDFGSAVKDLFGAIGSEQAAGAYEKEAQIAQQNALISETSTAIQQAQETRAITQAEGTEAAETSAAGFTMSGSAGDLMRQSAYQGALAKSLITQQGAITTAGYEEQAQAAQGKAAAAKTQSSGGFLGGLFGVATGVLSLF